MVVTRVTACLANIPSLVCKLNDGRHLQIVNQAVEKHQSSDSQTSRLVDFEENSFICSCFISIVSKFSGGSKPTR